MAMVCTKLTDLFIQNVSPDPKLQIEYIDEKTPGLRLRVSPGGTKSFYVWYRANKKARRLKLGVYGVLGLKDARAEAIKVMQAVGSGRDPADERRKAVSTGATFGDVVEDYIKRYASKKNRSWRETERLLQREFVTLWGGIAIDKLTKTDVIAAIDNIYDRGTPSAANHAFAALRGMFNWAVERDLMDRSPCQGLRKPAASKERDRVLTELELARVWRAAVQMGYPFGSVVRLLIATGQRRDEVAGMLWEELDLQAAIWNLSPERTKNNRRHEVHLNLAALEVLQEVVKHESPLVFPARGSDRKISGFSKWKRRLDELSGVGDWRLHDLRRTVRTNFARLSIPMEVGERILNHSNRSQGQLALIYNQYNYSDESKAALDKWSVELKRTVQVAA